MSKTDENLSPENKGERDKKKLAEDEQDKSYAYEVKFNLVKIPSDYDHPMKYRNVEAETDNVCSPFINLKLIMPMAIYDYYNAELVLYGLDYARTEDYLQSVLLDFLATEMESRTKGMKTEVAKTFLSRVLEQLNNINDEFLEKIPRIRPNDTFQLTDIKTKEKVTIDAQQLHDLIEGKLGERFPLDRE